MYFLKNVIYKQKLQMSMSQLLVRYNSCEAVGFQDSHRAKGKSWDEGRSEHHQSSLFVQKFSHFSRIYISYTVSFQNSE